MMWIGDAYSFRLFLCPVWDAGRTHRLSGVTTYALGPVRLRKTPRVAQR